MNALPLISRVAHRMTLYASKTDEALEISRRIEPVEGYRAGDSRGLPTADAEALRPHFASSESLASPANATTTCKNCGALTRFTEAASHQRQELGWCDPCFKQSRRTFEDKDTGKKRYLDELRTIDGIKTRFSRK